MVSQRPAANSFINPYLSGVGKKRAGCLSLGRIDMHPSSILRYSVSGLILLHV